MFFVSLSAVDLSVAVVEVVEALSFRRVEYGIDGANTGIINWSGRQPIV